MSYEVLSKTVWWQKSLANLVNSVLFPIAFCHTFQKSHDLIVCVMKSINHDLIQLHAKGQQKGCDSLPNHPIPLNSKILLN